MFYSEQLLTKEGPLAHVWLAANLEKKLSKQQLLQANITKSTEAIASSSAENQSSQAVAIQPLALRLSGQLLLGVVRIYSRKAKYLLDDVADALLRLKSAFKSSNSVTLPVDETVVPLIRSLTLRDTVTGTDLLYQEPLNLNFDDSAVNFSAIRHDTANLHTSLFAHSQPDFNTSIEIPRRHQRDDLEQRDDEDDLDLNFDIDLPKDDALDLGLDFDTSVEVGRAGEAPLADEMTVFPELSFPEEHQQDFDMGGDYAFDYPSPQPEEKTMPLTPKARTATEMLPSPETHTRQRRMRPIGLTDSGIRTLRKRLMVDETTEIPADQLRRETIYPAEGLSVDARLQLVRAKGTSFLFGRFAQEVTSEFKRRCVALRNHGDVNAVPQSTPEAPHGEQNDYEEMVQDFDLPQPESEDERVDQFGFDIGNQLGLQSPEAQAEEDEYTKQASESIVSRSTYKMAGQLREVFETGDTATTFAEVLLFDTASEQPLSLQPKKQATRAFFELLVLATGDAVSLKQAENFGEIKISARGNLYTRFV
ncbi:hypothetical protein BABINDRAFT_7028 [Babjeviella inositovora NRRL Y-12698]|uniref:Rad21/Rec8-like protein N-terminal domain-containing protein n=1 Tax=Babjeviella inositovora NRRL Y-12698 TaxID=984486 RepID=A0A1E3QU37_9ASCO|nr:uncharacterized protein BABINDRAFT_7028 [Babjeviella inositovora NRRL Y-12698]ODQ81205.1 hypothetical protein BABINDRAFT_7028 [Babjeviella inositovora NRRL Y-12698]